MNFATVKGSLSIHREKLSYVFINLLMAMLGFVRSYITMKYLGFYEVGLIAMVISVIEFVSMLQMGLLNGGFRMYFVNTKSVNKNINSMLFSYFTILFLVTILPFIVFVFFKGKVELEFGMLMLGVLVGIISLMKNWLTNLLIGAQKLDVLNKINVFSTVTSFLFIFLVPFYGLLGSILLIISQPIIFCCCVLIMLPELRPNGFFFKKTLLRKLLAFGFIPFLAGVLVKVDDQIERWGIINILGLDSLGKYNLVLIYCSLFLLVPASINPIFFPRAIIQYKNNDSVGLNKTIKYYMMVLSGYLVVAIGLTIIMLPYVINEVLPKYNEGVKYVWYIMPYLCAQILIMPLDFIYTLTARYRVMFISYVIAVIFFATLILFIYYLDYRKLEYFAVAKSIDGFIFVVVSLLGYQFYLKKKFKNGFTTKI